MEGSRISALQVFAVGESTDESFDVLGYDLGSSSRNLIPSEWVDLLQEFEEPKGTFQQTFREDCFVSARTREHVLGIYMVSDSEEVDQ